MQKKRAWKLFRLRKNGTLGSLFINPARVIPIDKWLAADFLPTKGFSARKGWHCMPKKEANHLKTEGRVWRRVEMMNWSLLPRPESQGGTWYLAQAIRVIPTAEERRNA